MHWLIPVGGGVAALLGWEWLKHKDNTVPVPLGQSTTALGKAAQSAAASGAPASGPLGTADVQRLLNALGVNPPLASGMYSVGQELTDYGLDPGAFDPSQWGGPGIDPGSLGGDMGGDMGGGFDPSQMGYGPPMGYDPSQMGYGPPMGYDPSQMGYDPSQMGYPGGGDGGQSAMMMQQMMQQQMQQQQMMQQQTAQQAAAQQAAMQQQLQQQQAAAQQAQDQATQLQTSQDAMRRSAAASALAQRKALAFAQQQAKHGAANKTVVSKTCIQFPAGAKGGASWGCTKYKVTYSDGTTGYTTS